MLKHDKSGITYCFSKSCQQTDCQRNHAHQVIDNETIYDMDYLENYDKKGNCKNKI